MLIIGGGITGVGVALDATTRGLSVICVDRDDFCAATSARSTKLIHGGVRYLEKAFKNLDRGQLELVQHALLERRHLLDIAPHLTRPLPILLPLYQSFPSVLFWAPYYWAGLKAYDFFAGKQGLLEPSFWMSRKSVMERFPSLNHEGLQGGLVYYDGQQNDTRMGVGIALTAMSKGALLANHVEVVSLTRDGQTVTGAQLRDRLTGETFNVKAKLTVNATGPYSDGVRAMARSDAEAKPMIAPSSGAHVVLSEKVAPADLGMLVPATSDGRVLFLLPWEGRTLAGTTDAPAPLDQFPGALDSEVDFILRETSRYLNTELKSTDVLAAWSGIRPLARDPHASNTESILRDHVIEETCPGLLTIAGGKWTTYRRMAQDLVDKAVSLHPSFKDRPELRVCRTSGLPIIGAAGFSPELAVKLQQSLGLPADVAVHLTHNYGDKAPELAQLALQRKLDARLAAGHPFLEAEVVYAANHEHACTAIDVIANRIRLAYLDSESAKAALPRVLSIMGNELKWDGKRKLQEYRRTLEYLKTMNVPSVLSAVHTSLVKDEAGLVAGSKAAEAKLDEKVDADRRRLVQVFGRPPLMDAQIKFLRRSFAATDSDADGFITPRQIILGACSDASAASKVDFSQRSTWPKDARLMVDALDEQASLLGHKRGLDDAVDYDDCLLAYVAKHGRVR